MTIPEIIFDFQHNKIIRDTITDEFVVSVETNLLPMLVRKYGDKILYIQMYEDYISDKFLKGGSWYYPLTLVMQDGIKTEWIRWDADKSLYKDATPYSYIGDKLLDFKFASPTEEFEKKLSGRAIYFEGGLINVRVDAAVPDVAFLSGKYSQTFIDEMSRQLTAAICEAMSVESFEGSTIELSLVFAPETYMEHTSENVTYRRMLLVDKGSAPRDFWIKWTRLDGATAYTIADNVNADNILFEIGEDVSQKVREKEYRCLLRLGKDKYHNAMGRKNVTEWRDVIKRAIRRGELVQLNSFVEDKAKSDEINLQLAKLLGKDVPKKAEESEELKLSDDLEEALRKLTEATEPDVSAVEIITEEEPEPEQTSDNFVFADFDLDGGAAKDIFAAISEEEQNEQIPLELPEFYAEEEPLEAVDDLIGEDFDDEDALADVRAIEPDEEPEEESEPVAEAVTEEKAAAVETDAEARIRAELETKIRLEYESRARIKAEEEAERLRREQEQLKLEHEKLQEQLVRERREQSIKEDELRAEEARLRAQIEMQLRAETRERERLAEAAKIAVEEQRRLETAHAKLTGERAAEARMAAEAKRATNEAGKALREKQAEASAKVAAAAEDTSRYTYTSKVVRLVFRWSVDPNITKKIQKIIQVTLEYYGKDKIYLKVKASVPDSETVLLEFVKIPMEEMELLGNIIKVLGNSGLGIAKAIVE